MILEFYGLVDDGAFALKVLEEGLDGFWEIFGLIWSGFGGGVASGALFHGVIIVIVEFINNYSS